MDIDQKMKSVKEIWNKKGSFVRTQEPFYEQLDTAGENLTPYQQTMVKSLLDQFLFSSIDAWLESMPKEVKKGIMKMDWMESEEGGYGQFGIDIEPIDKLKGEEVMDDYEKYRYVKVVQKDGDGYKVEPYTTVEENLIYRKKDEFSDAEIEGMIASAN